MRRLTAIMFADMVGYTALVQRNEALAFQLRTRMRTVLEREVATAAGEILQFYGDGALSIFPSTIEAVRCAVRVQSSLRESPEVPLRIGVHTGDVVHDEDGVFGDGVNVASRIEGLAVPGSVLVSGRVHDDIKNQPDIVTVPLGDFDLKNVQRPIPVFAIAGDGLPVPEASPPRADSSKEVTSVAVLPFVNMSSDPENEFFSDGVTEEIINLLTRVNGLKVTARTSSFAFKGRRADVREIGGQLGVGHVLEGSVRRAGERVRITAQLIGAADGYHVFSETYDRTIEDIFETQDEIARRIVAVFEESRGSGADADQTALNASGGGAADAPDTRPSYSAPIRRMDPAAHTEYLKGLFNWNKWTPDGARAAIADYERARDLDPDAALPRVGLAMCYGYLGATGQIEPKKAFPPAATEAHRALELDSGYAEAHVALAIVELMYRWRFDEAYAHFQKALSLAPGSATVHHFYSFYLLAMGDVAGTLEEIETAVALDPLSLILQEALGSAYLAIGRGADADRQFDRVLAVNPRFRSAKEGKGWVQVAAGNLEAAERIFLEYSAETGDPNTGITGLGYVYARQGRVDDALEVLAKMRGREARDPDVALDIDYAVIYCGLDDTETMFSHLESAFDRRLSSVLWLYWPMWEWVRGDPRYRALREKAGLPPPQELSPGERAAH